MAVTIFLMKYAHLQEKINKKGCGVAAKLSGIIDGELITREQIPWIVQIRIMNKYEDGAYKTIGCGGSIITRSIILTAASCFEKVPDAISRSVRIYYNSTENQEGPMVLADRYRQHLAYRFKDRHFDIALLHVVEPLRLDKFVRPVCVARTKMYQLDYKKVLVAGWGAIKFPGYDTDLLRYALLRVMPHEKCARAYNGTPFFRQSRQQVICTQNFNGQDVCMGDGGGPLTRLIKPPKKKGKGKGKARWTQVGIVSFLRLCNSSVFHSGHTRVSFHRNWIDTQIENFDTWDHL